MIGLRFIFLVGVDCLGSLKFCGVGFSFGEFEYFFLYRFCFVVGVLVLVVLVRVGFGCVNNFCFVDWEGIEEFGFGLLLFLVVEVVMSKGVWKEDSLVVIDWVWLVGVGFIICGLLVKGFFDFVVEIWVCVGSLNVVVNFGCFWLVDKKVLVGVLFDEDIVCLELLNEKILVGRFFDVFDGGVLEDKGMFFLELINENVLVGVLVGVVDVEDLDEKEIGCLELVNESFDENGLDVDEKVCLVFINVKVLIGRFLVVLGVDGIFFFSVKFGVLVDKGF